MSKMTTTKRLSGSVSILIIGLAFLTIISITNAFSTTTPLSLSSSANQLPARSFLSIKSKKTSLNENNSGGNNDGSEGNILDRFLNPVIDDPWLPLNEAGVAQIVAPTLQLFWLAALDSPVPSWASPLYDPTFAARGSFLAPTLIHGAALATCWLVGCVAAKGFEKDAYEGSYGQVLTTTIKAGAFACGILVLATQFDLYQDIGFAQPGDSPETDLRIYRALVEVINDVFFEATTLISYRLLRCSLSQPR